jgi:aspartokinase/homoserine dehydrogenase 1
MKVLKFGGSSLATADKFLSVFKIIEDDSNQSQLSVVLSAPHGVTNQLEQIVNQLETKFDVEPLEENLKSSVFAIYSSLKQKLSDRNLENFSVEKIETSIESQFTRLNRLVKGAKLLDHCPAQTAAQIVTLGERLSVALLGWIIESHGHSADSIEPEDFLVAEIQAGDPVANIPASKQRFREFYPTLNRVSLMPGFVGISPENKVVTLGRNGSDYSAAILAACVSAEVCEIWTDVDGVYNADPRLVKEAELVRQMSFNEAIELSYFGAKILHPKTITPLSAHDIPCRIKNSQAPENKGTLISKESSNENSIKAISSLDDVAMINISGPGMKVKVGMTHRIFSALGRSNIQVILISQSSAAYRISLCVPSHQADLAKQCLDHEFELELENLRVDPIELSTGLSVVSLVGDRMQKQRGIAAKFFSSLSQAGVNIIAIAQDSSERSISAVIRNYRTDDAVRICHRNLFLHRYYIDAFVIGCGTIGKELIEQIQRQQEFLLAKNIELKVYGIANSRHLLLDPNGIELNKDWSEKLTNSEFSLSLEKLNEFVEHNHLLNPVIIDATSSESISEQYLEYLGADYHVVTANKKANTASLEFYHQLRRVAQNHSRRFLYETNVAAGLPVIDNLQNLLGAGDQLTQFEGILSGSLSYIFGLLHNGYSLSQATEKARELGYTEPNPAEDLSGLDVARKVLIIARESGLELELEDIELESVIPEELASIEDAQTFMQRLPELDQSISEKVKTAEDNQKVLKYIAKIVDGKCLVSIESVDSTHPLYAVQDGENALAMHTRYYQPTPFVIRGYGAGASVTAAGLFADLLRTLVWNLE